MTLDEIEKQIGTSRIGATMSNKDTDGIAVKSLTFNGQRYIRLADVADVADLLRGFASAVEPAEIIDAKVIASGLRQLARDLEDNVTGAGGT